MYDDGLSHVTIVRSRYGGIYEPGIWLAFAYQPNRIPDLWDAGDVFASQFYLDHSGEIGGGSTPDEAYADLVRLIRNRRPT